MQDWYLEEQLINFRERLAAMLVGFVEYLRNTWKIMNDQPKLPKHSEVALVEPMLELTSPSFQYTGQLTNATAQSGPLEATQCFIRFIGEAQMSRFN